MGERAVTFCLTELKDKRRAEAVSSGARRRLVVRRGEKAEKDEEVPPAARGAREQAGAAEDPSSCTSRLPNAPCASPSCSFSSASSSSPSL